MKWKWNEIWNEYEMNMKWIWNEYEMNKGWYRVELYEIKLYCTLIVWDKVEYEMKYEMK